MTTPAEWNSDPSLFGLEPDLDSLDWSISDGDGEQEINDRRAGAESAETLRLARAL